MATSFKDRLTLDEHAGAWFDQTRRYMLIRPDTLMGLFRLLPQRERALALEALAGSVFEQGADSARAYQAMGGSGDGLIEVIAASAPQLGWGRWRFTREGDHLSLVVENSPFAAGHGPSDAPVCAGIAGMLQAVSSLVLERPTIARETACAAMGAPTCRFEAFPAEAT